MHYPCGRPQPSQQPSALRNRITAESWASRRGRRSGARAEWAWTQMATLAGPSASPDGDPKPLHVGGATGGPLYGLLLKIYLQRTKFIFYKEFAVFAPAR